MVTMRVVAVASLAALLCACGGSAVTRVFDGVPREGRFISDFAYAAFARGAEHEARGQLEEAALAYAETVRRDPKAAIAWVRRGAIACKLGERDTAEDAFARAAEIDRDFEPLWREKAECAREEPEIAVRHSTRAVAADPTRMETVLLHVELLQAAGRGEEAVRWLRSATVRMPHRIEVWEAAAAVARAVGDEAWAREATRRRQRLARRADPREVPTGWDEVDAALVANDLDAARRLSRRARLDVRLLPARAILAGRPGLAVEEARLRVAADPLDADARVALAVAEDLTGGTVPTAGWGRESPHPLLPPTRWLLAEWLLRHVGRAAAEQWLGGPVDDPREGLRRAFRTPSGGRG